MPPSWNKPAIGGLAFAALLAAALAVQPLNADVATDANADIAAALSSWEKLAAAGDPEAMFKLAQAYWLGRGVPADVERAEALCARAIALGHTRAADMYGLVLFELGRREAAIPYLRSGARHGDPRAQYLLGIAHFNGDFVEVDWPRAHALMTLAQTAGLPQAGAALAEMDRTVPSEQRQQAASLVEKMRVGAEDAWTADPRKLAQKSRATQPHETAAAGPPSTTASGGQWKVQLGAFSIPSNADALWSRIARRSELAGVQRLSIPAGRLTLLQAGGFTTRESAGAACASLRRSGIDCLVIDR